MNTYNLWATLVSTIGGLFGGGIITHLFLNKKYKAEAQATITGEALKLVQSLQSELELIKKEVKTLRDDNVSMHRHIAQLEAEKVGMQMRVKYLESELSKYKSKENT